MKYFLLIINQLARAIGYQHVSRAFSFSAPALPPYKDTKKIPHFLVMWITFFINIFDFISISPMQSFAAWCLCGARPKQKQDASTLSAIYICYIRLHITQFCYTLLHM